MRKIAFCFLTYDNLSQPELWNKIINNNREKMNIYIHNKNYFVDDHLGLHYYCINNINETRYANISIVRATLELFKTAFLNSENEFFILLSDSCVPLHNFNHIYDEVFKINSNIISDEFNNTMERFDYLNDTNFFDRNNFLKQSQWMVLNRSTVEFLINNDYTYLFRDDFYAPDEHYFINLLHKFNIHYHKLNINYSNWCDSNGGRPKTYYHLTNEEINDIKENSNHFFMRKINKDCILPSYYNNIQ